MEETLLWLCDSCSGWLPSLSCLGTQNNTSIYGFYRVQTREAISWHSSWFPGHHRTSWPIYGPFSIKIIIIKVIQGQHRGHISHLGHIFLREPSCSSSSRAEAEVSRCPSSLSDTCRSRGEAPWDSSSLRAGEIVNMKMGDSHAYIWTSKTFAPQKIVPKRPL